MKMYAPLQKCTIYMVLLAIAFLIIIGISSAYFHFLLVLKKDDTIINTSN